MGRKEENLEVNEGEKGMKEEWVGDKTKWREGTKPVEKGGKQIIQNMQVLL